MKPVSRALVLLVEASLLYNVAILASVTLDLDWVRTRAAGGQFDEFPVAIRIIYLFMAMAMVYLIRLFSRLHSRQLSRRESKRAQWIGILFLVSTVAQLLSRSADERWNAIPAAMIAYGFIHLARRR